MPSAPSDPTPLLIAKTADIDGIVQGVGFRPYIHRLAHEHRLAGWVTNTADGVSLWVEGPPDRIAAFFHDLPRRLPPLAHIGTLTPREQPVTGHEGFAIRHSRAARRRNALIAPDVAVCDDCLREMTDPQDRRYRYPFINCTNCGPRYTIIEAVPYDRPNTAMRGFTMCPRCQAEYDHPADRRFHAQPNACADCGPRVALYDRQRTPVADPDPIGRAARLLHDGNILAVKGLGGFHLAVDACNDTAVERLRQRKQREEKPLAVMAPDMTAVTGFAQCDAADAALLTAPQRPIVLLPKRLPEQLAYAVAPHNHFYGVMLPYTPLHHLLLAHGFKALVMTSANRSEEPIVIDNQAAFDQLGAIADYFLVHDRPIYLRSDDSIVQRVAGATRFVRRSRGYVPVPIALRDSQPSVLACGAELKNTICLTKGRQAFVSQHIGDLQNLAAEQFLRLTIDHLQQVLDITPAALACDLHPDYLSTQWARGQSDRPVIAVQHHHAHIAACMAEHGLTEQVLGLAFDGTGYGPDQTVWGGEILAATLTGFDRLAYLLPVPMPGAAAAIRQPWRMGLAYLHHAFGDGLWDLGLPFLRGLDRDKAHTVCQMAARRINAPLTSSLGRLFDGIAAILGLRHTVSFEGQAAMELEMIADGAAHGPYPAPATGDPLHRVDPAPIVAAVVADIRAGLPAFVIARKFHETVIDRFIAVCRTLRDATGLNRAVLSGGCFQNRLLLEGFSSGLQQAGFEVYSHEKVPTNDGGLSLGQAVVAGARLQEAP